MTAAAVVCWCTTFFGGALCWWMLCIIDRYRDRPKEWMNWASGVQLAIAMMFLIFLIAFVNQWSPQ